MKKILQNILDIFLEEREEKREILYSSQDLTKHYIKEIKDFALDGVYIATHYKEIRESIEYYKYKSDRQYLGQYVDLLSKVVDEYIGKHHIDHKKLVAVPMHWSRYMIRGYNHIHLITEGLSKKLQIPQEHYIQARFSKRQSKLSKIERMRNRDNVFKLKNTKNLPQEVILVDDIISTASTANACAKILKDAGVQKVYGIFLASNQ